MEGLNLETILDDEQIESLFSDAKTDDDTEDSKSEEKEKKEGKEEKENIAEVDPEELFSKPESVGNDDDTQENEEDTPTSKEGSSPEFYSSIAKAFVDEGIFPDLDEETVKGIKDADDFRKVIREQIKAELTEDTNRVLKALDYDVDKQIISNYEGKLAQLGNITEDILEAETEESENLRRNLLTNDYLSKGFSEERTLREVRKAFENGTDIEDSKDALNSLRDRVYQEYLNVIEVAKANKEKEQEIEKEKAKKIKDTIYNNTLKVFEDVELNKDIKNKAMDFISRPAYKNKKTGKYYTELQKCMEENEDDFLAKVGLMYALTDGFKNIDGLVKKKVKREVKKGFSELESKINNTSRDSKGNLKFTSGVDDLESIFGKGVRLDI